MCGRYALYSDIEQIKARFPVDQVACNSEPNYNVAPTQEVLSIVKQDGRNILDKLHWDLVPPLGKGYQDRQQNDKRPSGNLSQQAIIPGGLEKAQMPYTGRRGL